MTSKRKKWVSVGVGIIGLITITGLTDLMFLVPKVNQYNQQIVEVTPQITVSATSTPQIATSSTSTLLVP